jgi:hypothetical protein
MTELLLPLAAFILLGAFYQYSFPGAGFRRIPSKALPQTRHSREGGNPVHGNDEDIDLTH